VDIFSFAKHILQTQPEANAARLSLYHFLKNHYLGNEPLSPSVINRFFSRALEFPTIRENASDFRSEVRSLLDAFLSAHNVDWSKEKIEDDLQIVQIQNQTDLYEIVKRWIEPQQKEGEKIRILPNGESGIVLVRLHSNGALTVYDFDHHCTIRRGEIQPLHSDHVVAYNQELEPLTGTNHSLRVQPGVTALFKISQNEVKGSIIRGYTFNRVEEFTETSISRIPLVFYPLKRLERFFVNRSTDPLYIELTRLLDQAIVLLRDDHPEALPLASAAFERGQNAHQYIFIDDKLLGLLLRELSQLLFQKSRPGQSAEM
jgi:hypothetical protein